MLGFDTVREVNEIWRPSCIAKASPTQGQTRLGRAQIRCQAIRILGLAVPQAQAWHFIAARSRPGHRSTTKLFDVRKQRDVSPEELADQNNVSHNVIVTSCKRS